MPEFAFQPLFPRFPDSTLYDPIGRDPRLDRDLRGPRDRQDRSRGPDGDRGEVFHGRCLPPPAVAPGSAGGDHQGSRELVQRPLCRPRAHQERRHLGRPRLPDVPGHGHGDHPGEEGPAGLDRRERRGCSLPRRLQRLHEELFPLFAERRAQHVRREEHGHEPPGPGRYFSAEEGAAYKFLCVAKGGGSSNKTYLFQETKAVLNPDSLPKFLIGKMRAIGTAACPPYHIAFVVGGTSAEIVLKTVKLASARYLDETADQARRGIRVRDVELENLLLAASRKLGLGAAVRGQIFRPRHPRHPPAAARRVLPDRIGVELQRRPEHQGQDHPGRAVRRAARGRSGQIPPRPGRGRGACGAYRPQPADERDPGEPEQVPRLDAAFP